MTSRDKALYIKDLAIDKKADEVVALDMRRLVNFADYFVICNGTSRVHLEAIAEGIMDGLGKKKFSRYPLEGRKSGSWLLIDCGDVIVHIFHKETREFYRLDKLWGEAPKIRQGRKKEDKCSP